jgi:hypothetical protein
VAEEKSALILPSTIRNRVLTPEGEGEQRGQGSNDNVGDLPDGAGKYSGSGGDPGLYRLEHSQDVLAIDLSSLNSPHTKKPTPKNQLKTKGAIKLAELQPSIGPCVKERTKHIKVPIIKKTPY